MIKLTHPKSHTDEDIIYLLNKFEVENRDNFDIWISIEAKNTEIEIGELGAIQAEVYKFLRENAEIENHWALVSGWMDMRSMIRRDRLGIGKNIGGIHHG